MNKKHAAPIDLFAGLTQLTLNFNFATITHPMGRGQYMGKWPSIIYAITRTLRHSAQIIYFRKQS